MAWNDVLSTIKERVHRTLRRTGRGETASAPDRVHLEHLEERPRATPAADLYENDKEMLLLIDVPGGDRGSTAVLWEEPNQLTVVVRASQPLVKGAVLSAEYETADWYRTFALPVYVDGANATSSIKHGVLTVRLPKRGSLARLVPLRNG